MVFVLLVGLVVIWAHELQSDPVPLVASCRKPRNSFSVGVGRGYGWAGMSTSLALFLRGAFVRMRRPECL
jgi:hypothetical protein